MRRGAASACLLLLGTACQDPTQIKVRVSTQGIPCETDGSPSVGSTALLSGPSAAQLDELIVTDRCVATDDGAEIGDLTYIPRGGDDDATFTLDVYLGLNATLAEECAIACGPGCIRASRRMSFVPQQKLLMNIVGDLRCDGVCCDGETTCVGGECVPNTINPCPEDEPGCGDVDPIDDPDFTRTIIGGYRVDDSGGAAIPFFVGHLEAPGETKRGFVAPIGIDDDGPREFRCRAASGDVNLISAVPSSGGLWVLGTWGGTGALRCGDPAAPVTLDGQDDGNAFLLRLPVDASTPAELTRLASWGADTTVELSDLAAVDPNQSLVVGYLEGTVRLGANQNEISDTGLLLLPLGRSAGAVTTQSPQVIQVSPRPDEVQAVGREEDTGALVAVYFANGGSLTAQGQAIDYNRPDGGMVVTLAADNFSDLGSTAIDAHEIYGENGLAFDGLGYFFQTGDHATGIVAFRAEQSYLLDDQFAASAGCDVLLARIDGTAALGQGLGACGRIAVGRSRQGQLGDLVAREVGSEWVFGWPAPVGPPGLTLSVKAEVQSMLNLTAPNRLWVFGTVDEAAALDDPNVSTCEPDYIWGNEGPRPFVRCYTFEP